MTKYVLNSGGLRNHPEKGKRFLAEIVKELGSNPKMLVVLFAQPREDWEQKFVQYRDELNNRAPEGVQLEYELAFPQTFVEQVAANDIVYVHGGDDHLLRHWLEPFDIPAMWDGKVYAGSSAGSEVLVKHFWSCDWRKCQDGLGILPIKLLPHFKSGYGADDPMRGPVDWDKAHQELKSYGDTSLPIHALEEGDFVVINKN